MYQPVGGMGMIGKAFWKNVAPMNTLNAKVTKIMQDKTGVTVTYARTDTPPGLKRPEDIMKASDFWLGGLAPEIDKDIRARMQLDMLGLKYHYISNYPGSAEARLAIERNEVQVFPESMPTYRASIEPMVAEGRAIPLWYDPLDNGEKFSVPVEAAGIPAQQNCWIKPWPRRCTTRSGMRIWWKPARARRR